MEYSNGFLYEAIRFVVFEAFHSFVFCPVFGSALFAGLVLCPFRTFGCNFFGVVYGFGRLCEFGAGPKEKIIFSISPMRF